MLKIELIGLGMAQWTGVHNLHTEAPSLIPSTQGPSALLGMAEVLALHAPDTGLTIGTTYGSLMLGVIPESRAKRMS